MGIGEYRDLKRGSDRLVAFEDDGDAISVDFMPITGTFQPRYEIVMSGDIDEDDFGSVTI